METNFKRVRSVKCLVRCLPVRLWFCTVCWLIRAPRDEILRGRRLAGGFRPTFGCPSGGWICGGCCGFAPTGIAHAFQAADMILHARGFTA